MKLRFWCKKNSKCAMWICQWIIMCGLLFEYTCQSWPTSCWAEWLFCRPYGIICFTSLLIRQLYHFFATDFDRGVLQLVGNDIVNILFKFWVSYRHLIFIIKTFELLMKSSAKFDSLFVNIQCAIVCLLEKVSFKV